MSLLKKASIITTPTAYAEDYLYSIKPAYALGENLVSNGGFDTDTDWTKGTGWSISNGKAVGSNSSSSLYQATGSNYTSGKTYKIVFTVSDYVSGSVRPEITNVAGDYVTSNGTFTQYIVATSSAIGEELKGASFNGSIDNVSVKEITDADFDFDRNSTGTRVNEDYLIEDVPYNFLTYSTDFTFWTQADTSTVQIEDSFDNSNNAYRVSIASGTGFQTIRKTGLNLSGQQTFSIYAKKDTLNFTRILFGGFGNFWVDLANGTQGTTTGSYDSITITNAGNGFFRIVATFTATSPVTHIYLYPSTANGNVTQSSGSVIFQYAQLVKGDQPKDYLKTTDRLDIPRIDYTNGEPSILLEPSRTNLVTYSQDFSNSAWSNQQSSESDNVAISPEGLQNASKLIEDSSNNRHIIFDSISSSAGTVYTFSVFLKKAERSYGILRLDDDSPIIKTWFDLESGTIGTMNSESASIEDYGNGWYRCSVQYTADSSIMYAVIHTATTNGSTNYQGDGTSGIFMYGAQVEAGSYATSLIHTSGSAVTRSADRADNAGNSDLINSTEGVLYAEIKALASDSTDKVITMSDGSTSNRVQVYFNSSNQIVGGLISSGSGQAAITYSTDIKLVSKIAFKFKQNDFALWVNGSEVGTDVVGNPATGLNVIDFDNGAGGANFFGKVKCVAVFKEALTDLELEKLTGYNNHELYMNYYNRLSYLGLVEEYNVESDINNYIL